MESKYKTFVALPGKYKYIVVIVLAVIMISFLGSNSIYQRYKHGIQIRELEREIKHYEKVHKHDSMLIMELERNPKYIRKIARSRYFMKQDNEDIFVFDDEATE